MFYLEFVRNWPRCIDPLTGSVKGASTRNSNEFRMPRREAKGAA